MSSGKCCFLFVINVQGLFAFAILQFLLEAAILSRALSILCSQKQSSFGDVTEFLVVHTDTLVFLFFPGVHYGWQPRTVRHQDNFRLLHVF